VVELAADVAFESAELADQHKLMRTEVGSGGLDRREAHGGLEAPQPVPSSEMSVSATRSGLWPSCQQGSRTVWAFFAELRLRLTYCVAPSTYTLPTLAIGSSHAPDPLGT
jgi:hypothetical protein